MSSTNGVKFAGDSWLIFCAYSSNENIGGSSSSVSFSSVCGGGVVTLGGEKLVSSLRRCRLGDGGCSSSSSSTDGVVLYTIFSLKIFSIADVMF